MMAARGESQRAPRRTGRPADEKQATLTTDVVFSVITVIFKHMIYFIFMIRKIVSHFFSL